MDYELSLEAEDKLLQIFEMHYNKRDKYFGNARFARNLFEQTVNNHSNRVVNIVPTSKYLLTHIESIDIPFDYEDVGKVYSEDNEE
jgi:hypothetical protein